MNDKNGAGDRNNGANGANNRKSDCDLKFENTMLVAENAALRKELDAARAERDATKRQIAELEPEAERVKRIEQRVRDFAPQFEELKKAAAASDERAAENADLRQKVSRLEKANGGMTTSLETARQSAREWQTAAEISRAEKEAAETVADEQQKANQRQAEQVGGFKKWLIAVAAVYAVSAAVVGVNYYRSATPPPENLSAEAAACWQQYQAEYKQVFATAVQPKNERIEALQQEVKQLRAAQPSPFLRDENDGWGFWDWLYVFGFVVTTAVVTGIFVIYLFLQSVV